MEIKIRAKTILPGYKWDACAWCGSEFESGDHVAVIVDDPIGYSYCNAKCLRNDVKFSAKPEEIIDERLL